MSVRIQSDDFDVGHELAALRAGCVAPGKVGALVSFVGLARDWSEGETVELLTLEHYPGMTERALEDIATQARARWNLQNVLIIHRIGTLLPQAQIVLVAVASSHRAAAFEACSFIMDYLKTRAPFWKKEQSAEGMRWVAASASDAAAAASWQTLSAKDKA